MYMRAIRILILFMLTSSCESLVEVELDNRDSRLVVNSLFCADSLIEVSLSESRLLYVSEETPDSFVEEAQVELFQDGESIEILEYQNEGTYSTSTHFGYVGQKYQIRINTEKYGTASATSSIPAQVKLDSFDFKENFGKTDFQQNYHQAVLYFEDPDLTSNFYEVAIHYEYLDSLRFHGYASGLYRLFSHDPLINNELDTNSPGFWSLFTVFSDELIDGQQYGLKINFYNYLQSDNNYKYKITIYFNSISQAYYQYRKKMLMYDRSTSTSIWEDISEPVLIYSNIENAYGIFAGYQSDLNSFIVN